MIKQADMRVELPIVLDAIEDDTPETAAKAFLTGGKLVVCSAPRETLVASAGARVFASFEISAANVFQPGTEPPPDAPTQADLAARTLGEPEKR